MYNKIKRNLGFTLIELLAVILILGIIALIAIPTVNKVLEESKIESFKVSVQNIDKAITSQCQLSKLEEQEFVDSYTIVDGKIQSKVSIKGSLPKNAKILVDSKCEVQIYAHNGTYCAIKEGEDINIDKEIKDNCLPPEPTDESYFTVDNGKITDYASNGDKDVVIPDTIDGMTVTSIGEDAFYSKHLNSIVIPKTVSTIDSYAFYDNNIDTIKIPSSVISIGSYAFGYNDLTELNLPDSITTIDNNAFINNKLTSLELSSAITSIGDYAFESNDLTSLTLPSSIVSIGNHAFASNDLTELSLPSSLKTVGDFAFYNNDLTSATIPSSVTSLGGASFNKNKFSNNKGFIYARKSTGDVDNTKIVSYAGTDKIITIPSSVTVVGSNAFNDLSITKVTLPNNLTKIESYAFAFNNLTSLSIPSGVTEIEYYAFNYNSLNSISMPGRSSNNLGTEWYEGTPTFNFN